MFDHSPFEPTIFGYGSYYLGFCARYFLLAGGLYWFFQVGFKERWLAYRIQRTFAAPKDLRHEVLWSLINAAFTGIAALLTYYLVQTGYSRVYFHFEDYGWPYFFVSILIYLLVYDTFTYWQHRLMHTRWLFRHVHAVHHRVGNPTALATFALHPIENIPGNLYLVVFVALVPIHPLALTLSAASVSLYGIMVHLGYEFCPSWFFHHRVFGCFLTSTHHNMHHRFVGCNYGAFFRLWDSLMGTGHPAYDDAFDAIALRRQASAGR